MNLTAQEWRDQVYLRDPYGEIEKAEEWARSIGLEIVRTGNHGSTINALFEGEPVMPICTGNMKFCERMYVMRRWFEKTMEESK